MEERTHRAVQEGVPRSVALLTNFVPPYLVPFFRALDERVSELRILVSTRMETNRPWTFQGRRIPVHVQRTLTLQRTWRHPRGFSEIVSLHFPLDTLVLLHRNPPDVIVTTEFGFRTLQAVLYRTFRSRTRIVLWALVSELSERRRGSLREALRRWLLRKVDAVIVNGESGARYIRKFGFPESATFRVPYTTDGEAFRQAARTREGAENRRLLYVGQLIERKAVCEFLSALARWAEANRREELELWIVGDGPLRAALEQQRVPENLQVKFWGNVAYSDLPTYYARAGILVFPTLVDEWGVVVNEAMAAGLPVLGSVNSQAVGEMVEDGKTGWTFRPDHDGEILSALDRALSTPLEQLSRMRDRCHERARDFTPEMAARRMLAAIEFAAGGKTPQTCPLCRARASELHVLPHTVVWECEAADCKLRFAAPQSSDSDLRAAYRSLYYPDAGHGDPPACKGTPTEVHRELIQHLMGQGRLDRVPPARLLDYGCGRGSLAGVAQEFGVQVVGIEQDPDARGSACRESGLQVFEDIAHLLCALPDAKFDVIVLWQVIEHLRQPWAELERLRNLLTPDGCLVVATPNSDCLKARLQGAGWENFSNPTHFYYFADGSLSRMLEQSGLEVVDRLQLPAIYPHHSILRRTLQRFLRACRLNGDLLFVLRPVASEVGRESVQGRPRPGR